MELEILYRDDDVVAVHKPSGLLVHPSNIAADRITCMSILRDQLGRYVYPLHRLDRGTSGVLLMGLDPEAAAAMSAAFAGREVEKVYMTIVRGWMPERGTFDRPMRRGEDTRDERKEEAVTHYRRLAHGRLDHPVGPFPEARYSLVEVRPVTGRWHQIRRHFSNGNYPVVGDTVHGDGKHNRLFRELLGSHRLLLHALRTRFDSPSAGEAITVTASLPDDFRQICERFGWSEVIVE